MEVTLTDVDGETHTFENAFESGQNGDTAYVVVPCEHNEYVRELKEFDGGTIDEWSEK